MKNEKTDVYVVDYPKGVVAVKVAIANELRSATGVKVSMSLLLSIPFLIENQK